jgi:hypothetical protein
MYYDEFQDLLNQFFLIYSSKIILRQSAVTAIYYIKDVFVDIITHLPCLTLYPIIAAYQRILFVYLIDHIIWFYNTLE